MDLEDQELKYVCKFCNKRFPCGRSLGGHIRSHMMKNNKKSPETEHNKFIKKKLSSFNKISSRNNNNGGNSKSCLDSEIHSGYILRENPKKTWRLHDSSKEASDGKFYKTEVHKNRASEIIDTTSKEDSWISGMDSESDNEIVAPSRRMRSKRKTRYIGASSSSCSFSLTNNNNASSSVSEIDQEQEEVALCLMMLKNDASNWFGLKSVEELISVDSKYEKMVESDLSCYEVSEKWSELKKGEASINGVWTKNNRVLKFEVNHPSGFEISNAQFGSSRFLDDFISKPSLESDHFFKKSGKRRKFECTTCHRSFHSYQALGGHRASHNKLKGCVDTIENNIGTDDRLLLDHRVEIGKKKKNSTKEHECPTCFKVFSSGQALGGHKRSHVLNGNEMKNNLTITDENLVLETPDLLDLNLPASVEEETSTQVSFRQWWLGRCTIDEEAFEGLISN